MTHRGVIVFIPSYLYCEKHGFLYGVVEKTENSVAFYVLGKASVLKLGFYTGHKVLDQIGYYCKNEFTSYPCFRPLKKNWLEINKKFNEFVIEENVCDSIINTEGYQIIIYDRDAFLKSELLDQQPGSLESTDAYDHFKVLNYYLHLTDNANEISRLYKALVLIIDNILPPLTQLSNLMEKLLLVLKYSAVGVHIVDFLKNARWFLSTFKKYKRVTLKIGNYVCGIIADIILGLLLTVWFKLLMSIPEWTEFIANESERAVSSLHLCTEWLMGSPAGLKLNHPFNSVLGRFFLFHIDLWWSFLGIARPYLELSFHMFLSLGLLGMSFQLAFLADLVAVASFHIYCIYVYAARLYNLQVDGLCSLSRLFIGRKRNPLPGRVDSCPYTTEQLFIGTIAFTVLLFLLPTTLIYYIVFTTMRLAVIGVGGILAQARYRLQSLPLFVLWYRLFRPQYTASEVRLTPRLSAGKRLIALSVNPVNGSLWQTVTRTVPDTVTPPPPVRWRSLINSLIVGELVYPV